MFERIRQLLIDRLHEQHAPAQPLRPEPVYRPELIVHLHASHARLAQTFRRVVREYEQDRHEACLDCLRGLERALRDYLVGDNAEFLAFMTVRLEGDPTRQLLLRQLRAELRRVAHLISDTIQLRESQPLTSPCAPNFGLAFASIERKMLRCFETLEDELFARYHPIGAPAAAAARAPEPYSHLFVA